MNLSLSYKGNRIHYKNYFLLLVICLLAYWPIAFGIFSVKNDSIHYFLPFRFNISEAIHQGELPSWSPYLYLGYPVQGDMQSGAWNPVVWLFSFFGRYDLTVFHYENLLYIFLAGAGMYKLTNRLYQHSQTALLIAVSYMLSGFMFSGQLINWLAAAAFFPFVINYYLQTLESPSWWNPVKTGIALYLLLTAGYPSFFIITVYILSVLFIAAIIMRLRNKQQTGTSWSVFLFNHLILLLVVAGLSLPAIVSYIDLLPYYQRGTGTSYSETLINSFEGKHFLSFIFPSTIGSNDTFSSTDITLRNVYIGIIPLLFLAAIPPKASRRNIFLMALGLFAILFSLGDVTPVRKICYNILPFMNSFRHPSQMRLFLIFSLLLLTAPAIKKYLTHSLSTSELKRLKVSTWIFGGLLLLISIIAFFRSSFHNLPGQNAGQIRTWLKNIFDNITQPDAIALNGFLQVLFAGALLLCIKRYRPGNVFFSLLLILNMLILEQFVLPLTFVSKTSPSEINAIIHASPKGFPVNGLEKTIGENSNDAMANMDKASLAYFYNKKPGISHITNSPSFLEEQEQFLQNNFLYDYVSGKPVAYMADSLVQLKDTALLSNSPACKFAFSDIRYSWKLTCDPSNTAVINKLSSNRFDIQTKSSGQSFLVLSQNYHKSWKVTIDGKKDAIIKVNSCFMGAFVPAGAHTVVFSFVPAATIKALWLQLLTIIILILAMGLSLFKRPKQNINQ